MTQKKTAFKHHPKDVLLDHYHCTFFLPLPELDNKGFQLKDVNRQYYCPTDNDDLASGEAQAYRFFTPSIRQILYDCQQQNADNPQKLQAIKEWRLKPNLIKDWELHLGNPKDKKDPTKYQQSKITAVKLYQYFNKIYLLAIQVEPTALVALKNQTQSHAKSHKLFTDDAPNSVQEMCQQDKDNKELYQQLAMENWLHFTRLARLLYPSYRQQSEEKKIACLQLIRKGREDIVEFNTETAKMTIPQSSGEYFSNIIIAILKSFSAKPGELDAIFNDYQELYDDRMFVSVAYGIAGKKLPDESLTRINSLVSYVDRQEADGWDAMQGYAYTPEEIKQRIEKQSCRLWQGIGSYYTFTDFSNSYLSRGRDFRNFIATEHIPYIYDRMLIQALFYQASLRLYDNHICNETKILLDKTSESIATIRQQRQEFIQFTNQYWFHKLTEQMQGKEIFKLQQQGLGVKEHYEILKDELERTDEYLQTEHERKIAKISENIALFGTILAFLAIYYAILPMINDAIKTEATTLWSLCGFGNKVTGLIVILGVIPAVISYLIWLLKKFFFTKSKNHNKS